ncbi:hypothetical protein SDC9_100404 [bioreactor metagenome]|uniref:Uncharacterized protein n=1 Tax=bioreactor metagenome TaxID=1076179 RepID=A0A645AK95_9ZZZZ
MVNQVICRSVERVVLLLASKDPSRTGGHLLHCSRSRSRRRKTIGNQFVFVHKVDIFGPLIRVKRFIGRDCPGSETPVTFEIHGQSSLRSFFGCYHNHPVCTAGTVQCTGRGVLDNGHRFDIVGVDSINSPVIRDTVYDIKRRGRGTHGTKSPDNNRGSGTRLTRTRSGLHTGSHTVKSLGYVGNRSLLDFIGTYYLCRSGE